ncbi:MAG: SDR family oxidoreductase [Myxococcota bacterium]|nr:SDR family oxidoreductase [Myxococcota bacterium]
MHQTPGHDLAHRNVLVTGIADRASLALEIAREVARQGATPICAGLGLTKERSDLSERARDHLSTSFETFRKTVECELGPEVLALPCDLSDDESIGDLANALGERALAIDGVVHAVAFDRTLRQGSSLPLLETPREAFLDCMNVSAYSLIALARELVRTERLARGASLVALSYIGAERVVSHPYRNVAVAKAALERIAVELAAELGRSHAARVNVVRFSPYTASRAGGAIPGLDEAVAKAQERAPLGNALPQALGLEVAHLLRPGVAITGEVRHVDGGYHVLA